MHGGVVYILFTVLLYNFQNDFHPVSLHSISTCKQHISTRKYMPHKRKPTCLCKIEKKFLIKPMFYIVVMKYYSVCIIYLFVHDVGCKNKMLSE